MFAMPHLRRIGRPLWLLVVLALVFPPAAASASELHAFAQVGTAAGADMQSGSADGINVLARFNAPEGVALSPDGSFGLVADTKNHTIRKLESVTASAATLAGGAGQTGSADGAGSLARFNNPTGIAISSDGSFALVVDQFNNTIRRIEIAAGTVSTFAGHTGSFGSSNGVGTAARFGMPYGIAMSRDDKVAVVTDTFNHTIRKIDIATRAVTTLAGTPGSSGASDGVGAAARFGLPRGIALSADGAVALVADTDSYTLRKIVVATGQVTTLAGSPGQAGSADGVGAAARFSFAFGVALRADGAVALVADTYNYTLRAIDMTTGAVTTAAGYAGSPGGDDGPGSSARFYSPYGISMSADGRAALVADTDGHIIRFVALNFAALGRRQYLPFTASSAVACPFITSSVCSSHDAR